MQNNFIYGSNLEFFFLFLGWLSQLSRSVYWSKAEKEKDDKQKKEIGHCAKCQLLLCEDAIKLGFDIYAIDESVVCYAVKCLPEGLHSAKVLEEPSTAFMKSIATRHVAKPTVTNNQRNCLVYSNSKPVLLLINTRDPCHQYMFEIQETLHKSDIKDCHLGWIPDQCAFFLNEKKAMEIIWQPILRLLSDSVV